MFVCSLVCRGSSSGGSPEPDQETRRHLLYHYWKHISSPARAHELPSPFPHKFSPHKQNIHPLLDSNVKNSRIHVCPPPTPTNILPCSTTLGQHHIPPPTSHQGPRDYHSITTRICILRTCTTTALLPLVPPTESAVSLTPSPHMLADLREHASHRRKTHCPIRVHSPVVVMSWHNYRKAAQHALNFPNRQVLGYIPRPVLHRCARAAAPGPSHLHLHLHHHLHSVYHVTPPPAPVPPREDFPLTLNWSDHPAKSTYPCALPPSTASSHRLDQSLAQHQHQTHMHTFRTPAGTA